MRANAQKIGDVASLWTTCTIQITDVNVVVTFKTKTGKMTGTDILTLSGSGGFFIPDFTVCLDSCRGWRGGRAFDDGTFTLEIIMGTRCITNIRSRWDEEKEWKTHAVIYRHCEGYPESQGRLLFDFLDGLVVINGIPGNPPKRYANGPGRLAAQISSTWKMKDTAQI